MFHNQPMSFVFTYSGMPYLDTVGVHANWIDYTVYPGAVYQPNTPIKPQSHYSGVRWDFALRCGDFGSDSLQCDGIPLVWNLIRNHPSVAQNPSVRQSSVTVALDIFPRLQFVV